MKFSSFIGNGTITSLSMASEKEDSANFGGAVRAAERGKARVARVRGWRTCMCRHN